MPSGRGDPDRLDRLVAEARRNRERRERGYREQALKRLPWICARCAREFTHATVAQLTVHHKDGNHDNNPRDGSNWELLCIYCHENEHARVLDDAGRGVAPGGGTGARATHRPFADLAARLKRGQTTEDG
ncbi:MAG: YajD family HNH nuclease [Burkholderiales bacterium]|nr:YajD family HNH nuclease [Burkholderiales bacterium]